MTQVKLRNFHSFKFLNPGLSGVYTSNLSNDLDFYLGQILSLYEAKYLGQIFSQTFCFIEGQYLAQIKFQIVKEIECVDAALTASI